MLVKLKSTFPKRRCSGALDSGDTNVKTETKKHIGKAKRAAHQRHQPQPKGRDEELHCTEPASQSLRLAIAETRNGLAKCLAWLPTCLAWLLQNGDKHVQTRGRRWLRLTLGLTAYDEA